MNQTDSTKIKKQGSWRQLWWLWSSMIGFALGALSIFTPLYFHALKDWDLEEKTTLFPSEIGSIVCFYNQLWLIGGIVGALLALAAMGTFQYFKARPK